MFQVTNRDDLDQDYKSVVVEANKRFSSQLADDRVVPVAAESDLRGRHAWPSQQFGNLNRNGFGRDPNDLINAYGRSSVDNTHGVRFAGTWQAPLGITAGLRYSSNRAAVRPDHQRPDYDRASGRARRAARRLRTSRRPPTSGRASTRTSPSAATRRLRLSLDLINLLNSDTPTTWGTTARRLSSAKR